MLLIYSNRESWDALSAEQRNQLAADHITFSKEITESGERVSSEGLADPLNTKTVRVRNGVPATTDGPFAEAKEHLAGYYVVECESLDRALALAARVPDARINAVEVRPVMDTAGLEM
jgi:hypothetical protein